VYNRDGAKLIIDTVTKKKTYVTETVLFSDMTSNYVINVLTRKYTNPEKFPVINAYNSVEEMKVEEYKLDEFIISCVKQNYNNYVKIETKATKFNKKTFHTILSLLG
jgi:hypothetical protein